MAKKGKNPSVTVSVPTAAPNKLLQEGYDLIQTGNSTDLIEAENRFDQVLAQGDKEALNGLLVLANVYNSKEKLTLDGKELCWERDIKDNQKAYQILLKIKDALHGEDVLPGGLRLSDEFIQLGDAFESLKNHKCAQECYEYAVNLCWNVDDIQLPIQRLSKIKNPVKYCTHAAEQGNTAAMYILALMNSTGNLEPLWKQILSDASFILSLCFVYIYLGSVFIAFPLIIATLYALFHPGIFVDGSKIAYVNTMLAEALNSFGKMWNARFSDLIKIAFESFGLQCPFYLSSRIFGFFISALEAILFCNVLYAFICCFSV